MQTPSGQPLPRFTPIASADVHAARIKGVATKDGASVVTFAGDYFLPCAIEKKVLGKRKPKDGDWYVVDADGKASIMPAKDFEATYKATA